MPAFRVSGATGQAPTTVFMGAIPDKYNMLLPMYFQSGAGHGPRMTAMVTANFLNQWVPWNLSFGGGSNIVTASVGASTTAPDGTMTASHLTEGSNNGIHAFVAGNPADGFVIYRQRFAAILKAAERTRAYMAVTDGVLSSGVQVVWDLAGVQAGVAAATFGTNGGSWTAEFSQISSLGSLGGGGWCLCILDVSVSSDGTLAATNVLNCIVEPDSGSGTSGISNSYAGDGASGIYFWKGNLLPPRAWGLQNRVFFDDFNSSSTIDLNNTRAPGFNWYMNGFWAEPGFTSDVMPTIPSNKVSVSGSVMTLAVTGVNGVFYEFNTAAYLGVSGVGGAGVVGNTWQPPFLLEAKMAFDTGPPDASHRFVAWWTQSTNSLTTSVNPIVSHLGGETDYLEYGGAVNNPFFPTGASFTPDQNNSVTASSVGYPIWYANLTYTSGQAVVAYNGVIYESATNNNTGNQPDISPSNWTAISFDTMMPQTIGASAVIDFTVQNVYTFLWINDASKYGDHTDTGCYISFMNGILCFAMAPSSIVNYSVGGFAPWGAYETARNSLATQWVIKQNYQFPIFFQSSNARRILVDYASVTQ